LTTPFFFPTLNHNAEHPNEDALESEVERISAEIVQVPTAPQGLERWALINIASLTF
jgi:hypothetical protein